MPRLIAFYLPQFHPIPENNKWWGEGFTEWTNVGKAKPLFKGHYQPRVPADLGYYDLRLPESREAQADMARKYGVEGFCYWHYYFGDGRRLLERPFHEVLKTGKPDFPFCLAWANHSWKDKQFSKEGSDKMLIEQKYGGVEDYTRHFNLLLPAFLDHRYIRVHNKPLFLIHSPHKVPDLPLFMDLWQKLARENGLEGIHFVCNIYNVNEVESMRSKGFDGISLVRLFDVFKKEYSLLQRMYTKFMRVVLKRGQVLNYEQSSRYFHGEEDKINYMYPSVYPNWDHSPRSGRHGHILHNSNPKAFKQHVSNVLQTVKHKPEEEQIVFIRSWNEWAEGNYMEPDLRFGRGYLEALKSALDESAARH